MIDPIGCVIKVGEETFVFDSLYSCAKKYKLSVTQLKALTVPEPRDKAYHGLLPKGATVQLSGQAKKIAKTHWFCEFCQTNVLNASKSNHLLSRGHMKKEGGGQSPPQAPPQALEIPSAPAPEVGVEVGYGGAPLPRPYKMSPYRIHVEGNGEALSFDSILQCAKHFNISCPTIKKKLSGGSIKALKDYTIVERVASSPSVPPKRPLKGGSEDPLPLKKVIMWKCNTCQKEMRLTSKICHLISHKHLAKLSIDPPCDSKLN
jgi:hypothetical protein